MSPKILLVDRMYLNKNTLGRLHNVGTVEYSKSTTGGGLLSEVTDTHVIIVEGRQITERVIRQAKQLKGIVTLTVGYDHIDVKAASKHFVYVANCPGSERRSRGGDDFLQNP